MATISITSELDVIEKYKELITTSLSGDGVYIRTKETLQELFENGNFTDTDKANILSQVLGSLNNSVVQASMSTAMQWSNVEKEVALKKLELAKQLDILDKELLLKEQQLDKLYADTIGQQSQNLRMFGTATVVDGVVTHLADEGKMYVETGLLEQNRTNAVKQYDVLVAQEAETNATAHKIVADTYANYGNYVYTLPTSTGITAVTPMYSSGHTTLSDYQASIAKEQAKGYTYNAWANAANGVSQTVGVALTSELPIFDPGESGYELLQNLITTTNKLAEVQPGAEVYIGTDGQLFIYKRTRATTNDAWSEWAATSDVPPYTDTDLLEYKVVSF